MLSRKALWKSKDYDIPVEIIKHLGEVQGQYWVLVRSGSAETGVPLKELRFEEETRSENDVLLILENEE